MSKISIIDTTDLGNKYFLNFQTWLNDKLRGLKSQI